MNISSASFNYIFIDLSNVKVSFFKKIKSFLVRNIYFSFVRRVKVYPELKELEHWTKYRSSSPEMFLGKGVLKFTWEHPCKVTSLKSHFGMGVLM